MPEGDTIFRTAWNLRKAICGETCRTLESRDATSERPSVIGRTVSAVEARGKHLLVHFDSDHILHSHMGMTGSWHLYRPNQRWRKPARRAAVVLDFDSVLAVCFSPKTLEWLCSRELLRHPYLSRLGPDLLSECFSIPEAVDRFRRHPHRPIGDVLLDQTVTCGIGNVYKSELLFLERINPFLRVANLPTEVLDALLKRAQELMSQNLQGYPRRTRFAADQHRVWVYGRKDEPCLECGQLIRMQRQGDMGRSTYWCPDCQPEANAPETHLPSKSRMD